MLAALPPGQPGKGQLHKAFDITRVPVELDVLIDCDSISETTSCFEALAVLLGTHGIRTWRHSDDGPPADVRRRDDEIEGEPLGWVEVLDAPPSERSSIRPTVTHLARQFDGKIGHTSYMWGPTDRPESESAPAALLVRAATATGMGVLVTNRDQLTGGGATRWRGETLFQTPERAVATLGLLLRSTGTFSIRPYSVTRRGIYLWLALDSLIPHYGLWAAACSADGVAGPGRIQYLSTATEGRIFQALNARDQVAVAMSQHRIDWVDVADAVDRLLVFLLAAMDTTARVAYEIVGTRERVIERCEVAVQEVSPPAATLEPIAGSIVCEGYPRSRPVPDLAEAAQHNPRRRADTDARPDRRRRPRAQAASPTRRGRWSHRSSH